MAQNIKDLKAVYFSHDCNARNDEKIISLRMKHGTLGYGLYFMLLERLGSCTNYVAKLDYDLMAYELRESPEILKSVIENFGLFKITDDKKYFFSQSFTSRMAYKDKSSINGIIGNLIRHGHATRDQLDQMSEDEITALNNKIKSEKSGANSGANSGGGRNKESKGSKEKEKEKEERREREKDARAIDILKEEKESELDVLWMQNKTQIKDAKKLIDSFNDKMDLEAAQGKIEFESKQLMPRFRTYVRQWVSNTLEKKERESKTPAPDSYESGKLPRKNYPNDADRMYSKMKRL
ncbi:Lin1244/Lin1753 domain-containing protein [Tamlana sp. I1]|uniref:Lin1244/Lin1753 domain-containing protein n=1 Tax=Tamlana sp. I1 TaxID=2762061 RepID=UPI00188E24A7|nr:Lin1244/Lin1753 domain-containing protein [Tamlana sp. I1]